MSTSDFFKAGGTLHPHAPSYVARPTDELLFQRVTAGQFCYVLTTRQMGKSSLMIRTAARLHKAGIRTAIIDLSSFGVQSTSEQWYLAILTQLTADFSLPIAITPWWQAHSRLGVVQRFVDFINDVVLVQITGRVVIFFDEVDATRRLPFSDDFFAALRAIDNERAMNVAGAHLTFVLLGVAAPTSLIKDPKRTPFNIGQAIDLQAFTRADAYPLAQGLEYSYPGRGATLLDRIFDWTNGHPYLTQKLCAVLVSGVHNQDPVATTDVALVDGWVERLFLTKDAKNEENLHFVHSRMLAHADLRTLLALYRRIYRAETISTDERSPLQNELKLIGLITSKNDVLSISNEIYRHVFNHSWIEKSTALNPEPITALIPPRPLSNQALPHRSPNAPVKWWSKAWLDICKGVRNRT